MDQNKQDPIKGTNIQLAPRFFENEGQDTQTPQVLQHTFVLEKVIQEKNDGPVVRQYVNCLHFMKCMPFPGAMYPMDIVKKYTMSLIMTLANKGLILPFITFGLIGNKRRMKVLNTAVENYRRFADYALYGIYLKPQYYSKCPKAIWEFTEVFMTELGFSKEHSYGMGKIFATLIEYDDAYRYRFEDAMSEFRKSDWLYNPRKAVVKFAKIFEERDKQVGFKFVAMAKIAKLIFYIPSIKYAFKQALYSIDFSDLQLDDADRYFCHMRTGYNFFGMTDEERINKWIEMHEEGKLPPQIEILS